MDTEIEEFGQITTIADMSAEDFRDLRAEFADNEEISITEALELLRLDILEILRETPLEAINPDVRHRLATLAHIATGALVKNRQ